MNTHRKHASLIYEIRDETRYNKIESIYDSGDMHNQMSMDIHIAYKDEGTQNR